MRNSRLSHAEKLRYCANTHFAFKKRIQNFHSRRVAENLKKVGTLDNGLKVYVGNYKKETGLDTKPQLFLVAQEVEKKKPEAVEKVDGYLAVNYKKAVEK